MKCHAWPNRTVFSGLPKTNIRDADITSLCKELDKKTLAAFSGQPFMRGYSPNGVAKVLSRAGELNLTESWPATWTHRAGDCATCKNAAAFYRTSLQDRIEWRDWLQKFSGVMNQADAILLPFVIYGREHIFDDRGMWVAERDASVAALLISTTTGDLIWAGGRTAAGRHQRLHGAAVAEAIAYPEWNVVMNRLFVDDLWRDYPGRQEF